MFFIGQLLEKLFIVDIPWINSSYKDVFSWI